MMKPSNLEFRKVPSLKFLYEVSRDCHYIRNVKSKKYLKTYKDDLGRYCCDVMGKRVFMKSLVNECWNDQPVPIVLTKDGKIISFSSCAQAANWLVNHTEAQNVNTVRSKFKQRKKLVYGYEVTYRNAETGHAGLTRQGTVRDNVPGGHDGQMEQRKESRGT